MTNPKGPRSGALPALLLASALAFGACPALAQQAQVIPEPAPRNVAPETAGGVVKSIEVRGAERVEPATVLVYVDLQAGAAYDREALDAVLKRLYDTELFADVTIRDESGVITIEVRENPVVNRILFEGNRRLKEDKLRKEVRLQPRQVFTRAKVAADVGRIIELYRRSGRFAAVVEPKLVQLEQNRVDVVFEVREGARSKVRQINIVGNEKFSDGDLRGEMATKQARPTRLFTSNDTYDPDRLAYDQQKLRQFYLTQGYADFRVASAVAELTPDRKDFIITYVVEEGERYKVGEVELESNIRDIKAENFRTLIAIKEGDWYNAQLVEDSVNSLTEAAGLLGYAFADVRPRFTRDREALTMSLNFVLGDAPRVYVERVDINGNTITEDKVVRREFRLVEGDAFNSFLVKRSRDRVASLGYFQEKFEIEQKPGSGPDRVILEANLEEKPTGELQLSAGVSSLEGFLINAAIRQRNFRGLGQELRLSGNLSSYATSIEAGFTEPYLWGRNVAFGIDIFRRDYSSFRYETAGSNDRDTTYEQLTTGTLLRLGFPVTEFVSAQLRYGLSEEKVSLDERIYFTDSNGDGIRGNSPEDTCDPLIAGRYLCDALGDRVTSSIGYTLAFDSLDNRQRPSRGRRMSISQDLAGLGGDVKYLRTRLNAEQYWRLTRSGFILGASVEGGYIFPFGGSDILLTDRFYLGQPRMRGFDIRGVGPRVVRTLIDPVTGEKLEGDDNSADDSIGGQAYYLASLELEIPLGPSIRELGLRPSAFIDVGALWDVESPVLTESPTFVEEFVGDSARPRLSVGIGVNWNSPFGPFRIDLAKALLEVEGDKTQLFQFNVGGQF